jgi:acetyl esterase/lipase
MTRIVIDSDWFKPSAAALETLDTNRRMEEFMEGLPPVQSLKPQDIRDAYDQGKTYKGHIPRLDEFEDREIEAGGRRVVVRTYRPERVDGVYFHIHGGGFMLGRPYFHDAEFKKMADGMNLATVSVDYRLAPENPYPAGPDDCETAARWVAENAAAEFGTDRVFIAGESSGANLAAVTLVRMRDKHGFTGFTAALFNYGVFDLTMTPSCRNWGDRNLIVTTPMMAWYNRNYAPETMHGHPDLSPLYADLASLPPALFTVGTQDPLLDDSLFMAARWSSAGNHTELAVYPGGCHGFMGFENDLAQQGRDRIHAFIKER